MLSFLFSFLLAIKNNCTKTVKSYNPFINYNGNVFALLLLFFLLLLFSLLLVAVVLLQHSTPESGSGIS